MTDLLRPLTDAINAVRAVINEHEDKLSTDETKTRYILIDPILRALARIMREGVDLGETQGPPCGINVVYINV